MLLNKSFWVILLVVWIAGSSWWQVCRINQLCEEDTATVAQAARVPTFPLTDENRFRVDLPAPFNFARSGTVPNLAGFRIALDSIAVYLQNHPDRQLTLTGLYTASEINPSSFSNLGLARAESVRAMLLQRGVVESAVLTTAAERADLTFNARGDSVVGGVRASFGPFVEPAPQPDSTRSTSGLSASVATSSAVSAAPAAATLVAVDREATEESLAAAEKYESVFIPIDLYFKSGSSDYVRTDETKKFFKAAILYLRKNKANRLRITGYSDSEGPDDVNLELSKKRANALRQRLLSQGVSAAQIEAGGKGEADPKASNETESGRKANRRVTVVVQ